MTSTIKVDTVQDTDGNNIINENANTITIGASGDTISIPSGATLANSGTATGFASIAWQSSIVTAATHTAAAGQGLWLDTSSNAITLTLPASPSVGDQIIFTDYARNWDTNAVTLSLNGEKFQGNTSPNPVYDTQGESVDIVYSGSTKGWIPNTDGAVALETPQPYTADFLVIAGGGGGWRQGASGGGGAGGYRNSYASETSGGGGSSETSLTFSGGTVYTITVGAGGAGAITSPSSPSTAGGDSSISGSGITTITSAGGGSYTVSSGDGGSGSGGADFGGSGGSGTANQGFGGDCGGGGGAGEAGNTDGQGYGGDGLSSSITGSAVTRAGGGAGAGGNRPGGDGGGGNATSPSGNGGDATANTGSGGGAGAASTPNDGGDGGSGVVILRMPTASYTGTTSGSPTVTTSGSDTILTFNASGSYTG